MRSAPRDERDLVIAAGNRYLICLDNLSHLSPALSDAMCRVATGTGFGTRKLYTDTEETLIRVCRPQIINGIPELATRPDLLDRSIVLTLPVIPDEVRWSEKEFWRDFESESPYILGALLDAVSCALDRYSSVRLVRTPRMADFAQWVESAAPALGWKPGEFVKIYEKNRARAVHASFEADAVAQIIYRFALANETWTGTATELGKALVDLASESGVKDKSWPKTASHLSGCIRVAAPTLRRLGVRIEFDRAGSGRFIHIDFDPETASSPSPDPRSGHNSLKSQGDVRDGDVTADDVARQPAVTSISLNNSDRDGDDADDGVMTGNSRWGVEL